MSMVGLSEIEEKAVRFALENARIDGRSTSKREFDRLIADESHFLLRRLHDLHFLRWEKTNLYPTLRAIVGDLDTYAEVIRALETVIEFGKSVFQQDRENINVDELASALVGKHKGLGYTPTRFLFDCGLASFYPAMSVVQLASNGVPAVVCFHGVVQRMTKLDDVLAAQQREQALDESSAEFTLGAERAPGRVRQLLDELEQTYDFSSSVRAILRRDADEVEGARRALLHKSVLLLSGSILEGVLADVLGKRIDLAQPLFERGKKRKPKFPDEASLRDLLELATNAELPASCGPLLSAQVSMLIVRS